MRCVLQVRQHHLKNTAPSFYVYLAVTIWKTLCPKNFPKRCVGVDTLEWTYRTNPPCRCFLKWWYPTTMVFLSEMIILGCFGGTTIWGNTHLQNERGQLSGCSKPRALINLLRAPGLQAFGAVGFDMPPWLNPDTDVVAGYQQEYSRLIVTMY